jgi:hypothetical protein
MRQLSHTKEIFQQLADTDGSAGVQTIIENHDAWVRNAAVQSSITLALRTQLARMPRPEMVTRRIAQQRHLLASLSILLPAQAASAG